MDNVDYFKTLMALIKTYKQYAGPFGCCINIVNHIEKIVAKTVAKAKEQGHPLTSDEVMVMKSMEEQKVWDLTVKHGLIKHADKRKYGELQASLTNRYTLGENRYPDTVEKAMSIMSSYKWPDPCNKMWH